MNITVPQGYQQTKVGAIPEEWEALPAKNYFEKSIEKGYDGLEIYSVTLNISWQKRSELEREIGSDVDVKKSLLAREGYLVYNTMRMWQGALGLAESTGVVSPAYIVLKPKAMIDPQFAFYQLKSYRYLHYLKSYSYGLTSDRLRLYFNDFGMIPFVCPPLKEQQKIAKILTTWDKAISKQEALIAEKEQLKKGLMQKLLSGEVRFKGFDEEWEKVKLGEICTIKTGTSKSKFQSQDGKYFIVDMGSISKTGKLIPTKKTSHDKDILNKYDLIMPKDDIGGGQIIGRTAMIDMDDKYIMGDHIYLLKVEKDDPYFIHYAINSFRVNKSFRRKATGTAQLGLNKKSVEKQNLLLPKVKQEQQKIAQLLTTADKEIELLKEELEALKEQKRGLMQRLLTGEVRVRV